MLYVLVCDCAGWPSGVLGPTNSSAHAGHGNDAIGCVASTSCSARARPPNHAPDPTYAANGSARAAPVPCDVLYPLGEAKSREPPSRVPVAGLTNGSSSVSARAMATPPIPMLFDGNSKN